MAWNPEDEWNLYCIKQDIDDARIRARSTCHDCRAKKDPADSCIDNPTSLAYCPFNECFIYLNDPVEDCVGFEW